MVILLYFGIGNFYTLGGGKAAPLWDLQKEGKREKQKKKRTTVVVW